MEMADRLKHNIAKAKPVTNAALQMQEYAT